ncbi:MAG: helix-turn-helix domain-containing protein [Planctomycetota bacterium]|jgi:excisionase family DNA binding protein
MGKKMYYTTEEALARLGISAEELQEYVSQGKLRAYADGESKMYKADEVDALGGKPESEEIELMPASPEGGDAISLSESDTKVAGGDKEDTVITSEGISIFDEEDLEIETADPMAKTHMAVGGEDQVLIEGVGSGSGLLDLTRESDDTSLGPGVLEHIDMEEAVGSDIGAVEPEAAPAGREAVVSGPPVYMEAVDATAGLFTGVAAACALMVLLLVVMTVAAIADVIPGFLEKLRENVVAVIIGGIALAGLFGLVGMFMGKSMAARQEAMRRLGR